MIAYWMLYSVAVGVPVLLAVLIGASVLRRHGRAERFVWCAGMGIALLLPVLAFVRPFGGTNVPAMPTFCRASTGKYKAPSVRTALRSLRPEDRTSHTPAVRSTSPVFGTKSRGFRLTPI